MAYWLTLEWARPSPTLNNLQNITVDISTEILLSFKMQSLRPRKMHSLTYHAYQQVLRGSALVVLPNIKCSLFTCLY